METEVLRTKLIVASINICVVHPYGVVLVDLIGAGYDICIYIISVLVKRSLN